MPRFVQVLEGETARTARPVLATADPRLVGEVMKLVLARLAEDGDCVDSTPRPAAAEGSEEQP